MFQRPQNISFNPSPVLQNVSPMKRDFPWELTMKPESDFDHHFIQFNKNQTQNPGENVCHLLPTFWLIYPGLVHFAPNKQQLTTISNK